MIAISKLSSIFLQLNCYLLSALEVWWDCPKEQLTYLLSQERMVICQGNVREFLSHTYV